MDSSEAKTDKDLRIRQLEKDLVQKQCRFTYYYFKSGCNQ